MFTDDFLESFAVIERSPELVPAAKALIKQVDDFPEYAPLLRDMQVRAAHRRQQTLPGPPLRLFYAFDGDELLMLRIEIYDVLA